MEKYAMIIDVEKCEDCNNCFLACKDEHVGNEWVGFSLSQPLHDHKWINIHRKERGQYPLIDVAYLPVPCMHCDSAPCIKASKNGAVTKRDDGIVLIDPEKSKGQKELVASCPYNAIWWNERKEVPQKCTFCAHLLESGWEEPRCVQACPTGALKFIKADEPEIERIAGTDESDILKPELNTRPRVYYNNLFRYEKCFVSGSIAIEKEGVVDCAERAKVTLKKDGSILEETTTDNFGDFKFDKLEENSGEYNIEITVEGYDKKTVDIVMKESISMETVLFR